MAFELRTQRLILRHWRDEDRAPFAELNADPRVMEFFPAQLTRAESDASMDRILNHFDTHGYGLWAAEIIEGERFVGFVGLVVQTYEAAFTPCVEVGWRLAHPFWGKGLAPEGAQAALDHAWNVLRLNEVVSTTAVENRRSRRVMEKLHMTYDPADDFDHPLLSEEHPLRRHVLYRISNPRHS